ncbi:MAG: helix-turn-helix domain-containing protein [Porticoccaceae bacterium]
MNKTSTTIDLNASPGALNTDSDADQESVAAGLPLPGVTLRKARADIGISLEEIADKTGLSRRYLKALEEDDYDRLPGKVYIIGYLRRYSALVNVNSDEVLVAFEQSYREHKGVKSGGHGIELVREKFPRDKVLLVLGAGVALILIVVLMAFS